LPVDIIYELFNLNSDDLHDRIKDDFGTVKDTNFNRMAEGLMDDVGRKLSEGSDMVEKMAKYLNLTYKEPEDEFADDGGDGGFDGGFDGDGEEEEVDHDEVADSVSEDLDHDASDDDIQKAIDEALGEGDEEDAG